MRLGLGTDISVGYRQPLFGRVPFLLDTYTGAAAAYSLRQLRTGVTNVVRVREDSGNTEQDFTAEEITDGTLLAFVGAGNNGYVVTWYDQSGNANNATQSTAADQPKIVSSGSLATLNSLPTIDYNGGDFYLQTPVLTEVSTHHIISVSSKDTTGDTNAILYDGYDTVNYIIVTNSATAVAASDIDSLNTVVYSDYTGNKLFNHFTSNGKNVFRSNGLEVYSNTDSGTRNATGLTIGNIRNDVASGFGWNGKISEVIYYQSDQTANSEAIETDINSHYSIY